MRTSLPTTSLAGALAARAPLLVHSPRAVCVLHTSGGDETSTAATMQEWGGVGQGMPGLIGRRLWAIPEGYIPLQSHGQSRELESHEAACLLNAGDQDASIEITVFFSDREPCGPYRVQVPARRTLHLRFNDLRDPAPIPRGKDYASVIVSDVPIVVQHTRLDSRQAEEALLSSIAYSQ